MNSSTTTTSSIILFWSLFLLIHMILWVEGCIESERDALLQFKNGLTDPSNRLADWVADGSNCCGWTGVVCHNVTAHVIELHLRTLSVEEYRGPDIVYREYDYQEYEEYYEKSAFGGKVSSSLLHLNHLSYLDLSNNDFWGVSFPKFIGSIQSLKCLNLSRAGFVGIIPQLRNLSNLQYLNLAASVSNVGNLDWVSSLTSLEFLDLSYVDLSRSFDLLKVINSIPSLVELRLSNAQLLGFSPSSLPTVNFSSLLVLDLSYNNLHGSFPNVLQNITSSLLVLDLSYNYGFNSSIPNWLYDLTHIQLLHLQHNELQGHVSSRIGNMTSLVSLDLSYNYELEFENGIPYSFQNFCNLRSLHLSYITLNQEMNDILKILSSGCVLDGLHSLSFCPSSGNLTADSIGHLKNLRHLSVYPISDSVIHGPMSTSFKHLCNLRSIDLSGVKLNQEMNDLLSIMSGCVSNSLQSLTLYDCKLSGHLTNDLRNFTNLIIFDISSNSISGPIPLVFGNLKKLELVNISNNKFEGEVSQLHFENLMRLYQFDASGMGNNMALRVRSNWIPPPKLYYISLESWNIGPQFPIWLRLLKHLSFLDLSNSGISTPFPVWFWDSFPNYGSLNFSHNQMYGSIPNTIPFASENMPTSVIDLSSNNFSGAVPYFSSKIIALDLSNNSFSGSIHHFLCNEMHQEKQMQVLNLERNLFSGEIPDCWRSWKNLAAIKLSNNKFTGHIPNSIGTLSFLHSLHLRNNNLSGEVPSSIQDCKMLVILDFSENKLVGNIPTWIGDGFDDLRILILHSNNFDGYLPEELCRLVSLHILDLAHNSFYGPIPSCFSNFTGMSTRDISTGSVYVQSMLMAFKEITLLMMKGRVMEYSTNLGFVRSIDLSNNNFSGEIPPDITTLTELLSLNLSQNALTGRIPNNIGDMKALEAVDFSHNQLSGEIPQSASTLTFLSILDLSYNNLSGRIPSGTQLQSFNSSSFIGNKLCGLPLTENCSTHNAPPASTEEEEEDEGNGDGMDIWFYASMAFGFVFGFWSVAGSLIFIKRWRYFYFNFLNNVWDKIWWSCFLMFRRN